MTPEETEKLFTCSTDAGDFLVEIADQMVKVVRGRRKYRTGYPHYFPGTWMIEEGAKIVKEAVLTLTREDALGLIPELTIIHAYLRKLIGACEESEIGFLAENLRRMSEVPEGVLNQPRGRINMYMALKEAEDCVGLCMLTITNQISRF